MIILFDFKSWKNVNNCNFEIVLRLFQLYEIMKNYLLINDELLRKMFMIIFIDFNLNNICKFSFNEF